MKSSLFCFALALLGALAGSAQVSTGTITGSVRDASDAVVAGAKALIVQQDTGERRETITNERGEFNATLPAAGIVLGDYFLKRL